MLTQTFLRSGGTLNDLLTKYAITAKRHKEYPNLVLLKYSQIESPFHEPIVRECRGVILDEENGWATVSRSFSKFFNSDEVLAAEIHWPSARVQEKLDGSLCTLYHYDNHWHVQTSGSPDASGSVHGLESTFKEYFWDTFSKCGGDTSTLERVLCYMFELCGPDNRVVVVHPESKLVCLGARNRLNGIEWPAETCSMFTGLPTVQSFSLTSIEAIRDTFADMSPLKQEGYVVVDKHFNRVKVKHPKYVQLHRAKDGMTEKAFLEIARMGETPEVIAAFPEFKPLLDSAVRKVEILIAEATAEFESLMHLESQKEFALEACKTRCKHALFAMRKGQSARDYFAEIRIESLMGLCQ